MRSNPNISKDPLSEILTLIRAKHVLSGGFSAGGVWAIRFPEPKAVKFGAIVRGSCWLKLEGFDAPPVQLKTGDVILLNGCYQIVMSSGVDVQPTPAATVFADVGINGIAKWGEAEDFFNIGGHVELDDACAELLLDALPPLVHLQADAKPASSLNWLLHQLISEMTMDAPGATLASFQIAQLILLYVLRGHLGTNNETPPSWLGALRDRRIATALRIMHGDPSHRWVLEDLARATAMSRTNFSLRFKELVGVAPLTYLTEWRMRLAVRALIERDEPLSTLALSLGYASESAFSNAFKRIVGIAPKRYRAKAAKSGL